MDFNERVYLLVDDDGYFSIDDTNTLGDIVIETAEETTSPRGVEDVMQVVDNEDGTWSLCRWIGSKLHIYNDGYDSEEEAYQAKLDYVYENDFFHSDISGKLFFTKSELISTLADILEVPYEVAESNIRWAQKRSSIKNQQEKGYIIGQLKRALVNSKGQSTKQLKAAYNRAKWTKPEIKSLFTNSDLELIEQVKELVH